MRFDNTETEALRARLVAQRDAVRDSERSERHAIREGAETFAESGDAADASQLDLQIDLDVMLLQMRSETERLLDRAIARIDEGTYGVCERCGGRIAQARLTALPFAETCRRCAEDRNAVADHRISLPPSPSYV